MKNIYLCGFMGCGKTSVAKIISKKLKLKLIDTDIEIQKAKNMNIFEIFQKHGEQFFRNLETEILKDLQNSSDCVISTGGGTLLGRPENANLARSSGNVVFLKTPFEICWERIKNSQRPLIFQKTMSDIKRLFNEREKKYQHIANMCLINDKSSSFCAKKLILLIKNRGIL